ncbi:MAG: NAD-binding protein, partial [Actinomycetota bacterium]
ARYIDGLPSSSTYASATPMDVLYYSLQLFVLAAEPLDSTGTYPVPLEVARLLAPFTTILALVEGLVALLRDRVVAFRISSLSGHTIVTGATPEARLLASRLAKCGKDVVWVSPNAAEQPAVGVRPVTGNPNSSDVLKAAGAAQASLVYACAASDSDNFATAVHVGDLKPSSIRVLAEVRNEALVSALRARRLPTGASAGYRLDFFALESLAAQELLRTVPPKSERITITGFNWFGQSVLRHILRRAPGYEVQPAITVVTPEADAVDAFVRRSGVPDGIAVNARTEPDAEPGLVYVCSDSDDEVLRLGLGPSYVGATRIVLCLQQENAVAEVFEAQLFDRSKDRIEIFRALERACDPDLIGLDIIETMAHALHENYLKVHGVGGRPLAVEWDDLPDHGRELNYSQAEHIGVNLNNEGMEVVPIEAAEAPFEFLPDEIERLAEKEHERWRAQKEDQDRNRPAEEATSKNPNLVDWAALSDEIKLSNEDTISFIPTLLAEHGLGIRRFSSIPTGQPPRPAS